MRYLVIAAIALLSGCSTLPGLGLGTAGNAQTLISSALYALATFNASGCIPATAALDPVTACSPDKTADVNGMNACLVAIAMQQIGPKLPRCTVVPAK